MEQSKRNRIITQGLGVLLIGLLVQGTGWLKGNSLVFPGVGEILRAFFALLGKGQTYRLIGTTVLHLAEALVLSSLAGIALGLLEGVWDFAHELLTPLMTLLRSIPMVVLAVVIMVLTKYERVPLIATSLILIPLISEAVCEGCRAIPQELLDVYRLNSPLNLTVVRLVYLPMMAGYLRQAYVSAVGMGVKMVVSTEYLVQTRDSLGKAIHNSIYFNDYQDIYAYVLLIALVVLLLGRLPAALISLNEKHKKTSPTGRSSRARR